MRAAVVLTAVVLAGCGGGDGERREADVTPAPTAQQERVDEAEKALRELEDSDLPEDARRELEEAKELLDESPD